MAEASLKAYPAGRVPLVDVHAHAFPPDYVALAPRIGGGYAPFRNPPQASEDLAARFERMEAAGVSRQVLSPSIAPYAEDEALATQAARLVNDRYAELTRRFPDRFSMWASLPLPHVDRALEELRRGCDELGAVGVTLHCFCLGRSIASMAFEPVYRELNARKAVVFLHPCQNGVCSPLINEWGLTVCVGASLEDSLAALHLIQSGVAQRYPDIRFIVPHFGGILPMLLERLDGQMPREGLTEPPSVTAKRFYYDTVGWGSQAALLAALEAFGAQQLLPGSDYPYLLHWESYSRTFDHLRESGLPAQTVETVLGNAARLLKLDA
jgi:predicted TIM-barrel fold metal-dependent hydrolase